MHHAVVILLHHTPEVISHRETDLVHNCGTAFVDCIQGQTKQGQLGSNHGLRMCMHANVSCGLPSRCLNLHNVPWDSRSADDT